MARVSKVDTCIFCSQAPCVCNQPAKPAPKPRKRAAKKAAAAAGGAPELAPEAPREKPAVTSIHDAMRAAAKVKVEAAVVYEVHEVADMDEEMRAAVRLFGDMLHPTQKSKWSDLFKVDRLTAWKARRNGLG